jgi:hypothetical protein
VTVAGDEEVRAFDVGEATTGRVDSTGNVAETQYNSREHCIRLLKCHTDRVKRIVSEESPDLFLTIAEVLVCHSGYIPCKFLMPNLLGWNRAAT